MLAGTLPVSHRAHELRMQLCCLLAGSSCGRPPELRCCVQNPDKFKSQMHSLAYGNAMMAAARDYQQARAWPMLPM